MQKNEAENDAVLDAGDPLAAILRTGGGTPRGACERYMAIRLRWCGFPANPRWITMPQWG